jgi:hypothetical protein
MIDPTTLSYGRTTNIAAGTCNNVDFVLLYLAYHGPSKAVAVNKAHAAWRGKPGWRYPAWFIFSREFGFVSHDFYNVANAIRRPCYGFGSNRSTLIHNPSRGVYALNANGCLRLARLILATV